MTAAEQYAHRLAARRAEHVRLEAMDARLAYARLTVFGAGAAILWLVAATDTLDPWTLLLPAAAFLGLVRRHAAVIQARERTARAIAFYERGRARLEDRWQGGGEAGERFRDPEHPYAEDLDLFGRGSLFELLSVARTRAGEETLARWLLEPAAPDEVRARQEAVRELAPMLDFRETLALTGSDVRASVHSATLATWATTPAWFASPAWQPLIAGVTAAGVGSVAWWLLGGPVWPLLASVLLVVLVHLACGKAATAILHGSGQPVRDLDVLAQALEHLERSTFTSGRLRAATAPVVDAGGAARAIRRLHRLSERHDWQHNVIFAFVAAFLLWGPHLALAVERWRRRHGARVVGWLTAVAEVEALASLAAYAFEHPADVFPELVSGQARFDAAALGHPLLPAASLVVNDVGFGGDAARLLIVSGSNMSGKSTLLRAVGVSAVMAFAGGAARAGRLTLTPLAIGATLRVQDSIQDGRSRFFAEITRLRQLADLAGGPAPLLFLLDELLHGTNSHDRLAGGTGVLRALLAQGAVGLVTTHDLALTALADELGRDAANVHFEDTFVADEVRFDYRMRPGPVTRSNALALMRAIGLDVPPA